MVLNSKQGMVGCGCGASVPGFATFESASLYIK